MNQGKYVFSQVIDFLPARLFDRCVSEYEGNKWIKHFSCWNQMLCMVFGQLSGRDSLRDLSITIEAHSGKNYHLGLGRSVSRSNLANANERRNYHIYEAFAYEMISIAKGCLAQEEDFMLPITDNVYAFDSTTIDLCLNIFWWADFRKTKGAIKVHTLYDIKTSIPTFVHITTGNVADVTALDALVYEPGGYYVLDRAYVDFKRLFVIHSSKAFFVIRAKDNLQFRQISSFRVDKRKGIIRDQIIRLKGLNSIQHYPEELRKIEFYDAEQDRTLIFLTNNTSLCALDIALLYKYRWKVELFFKWIKQHLKIKAFWGTLVNAVKTQVYTAIITFVLVAIIRSKLSLNRSTYEILQILSVSLFDKTPLNQLLQNPIYQDVKEQKDNQLKFKLI